MSGAGVEVVRSSGGVQVLRAAGELDASTAPALLPRVDELVGSAPAVVLDLSEVTFLDSSGVRLVDRFARACLALRVVAPTGGAARRVLEIVGMVEGLVEEDVAAAVAAARPRL